MAEQDQAASSGCGLSGLLVARIYDVVLCRAGPLWGQGGDINNAVAMKRARPIRCSGRS